MASEPTIFIVETKDTRDFYGVWTFDSAFSSRDNAERYIDSEVEFNDKSILTKISEITLDMPGR